MSKVIEHATIKIAGRGGTARIVKRFGPLCVTELDPQIYSVTHEESGCMVGHYFGSLVRAARCAKTMLRELPASYWTESPEIDKLAKRAATMAISARFATDADKEIR